MDELNERRKCIVCGAPVLVSWSQRDRALCDRHFAEYAALRADLTAAEEAIKISLDTIRVATERGRAYGLHRAGINALTHVKTLAGAEANALRRRAVERAEQQPVAVGDEIPW